jgi:hypothetical protein
MNHFDQPFTTPKEQKTMKWEFHQTEVSILQCNVSPFTELYVGKGKLWACHMG